MPLPWGLSVLTVPCVYRQSCPMWRPLLPGSVPPRSTDFLTNIEQLASRGIPLARRHLCRPTLSWRLRHDLVLVARARAHPRQSAPACLCLPGRYLDTTEACLLLPPPPQRHFLMSMPLEYETPPTATFRNWHAWQGLLLASGFCAFTMQSFRG